MHKTGEKKNSEIPLKGLATKSTVGWSNFYGCHRFTLESPSSVQWRWLYVHHDFDELIDQRVERGRRGEREKGGE